jgi:DNA-binding NtrC family response regulator
MSYVSSTPPKRPSDGAPAAIRDAADFCRRTVLLVDDDAQVLNLLSEVMSAMGHKVITAHDGKEALARLLKNRSIDCLFTDMVMPNGMTGLQLMTAARAVRPGLPALLASAYPREDVSALGDIPEDVDFIAKPYLLSDLTALLDRRAPRRSTQMGVAGAASRVNDTAYIAGARARTHCARLARKKSLLF